jgi:hypothetical protein
MLLFCRIRQLNAPGTYDFSDSSMLFSSIGKLKILISIGLSKILKSGYCVQSNSLYYEREENNH